MPRESLFLSTILPLSPRRIYDAWIDADEHSAFTGGAATSEPRVGGAHSAWDGYITGTHLELVPGRRIVQSWRSEDFPDDADDSRLEVVLREVPGGTEVTLVHTEIPEGQAAGYQAGWEDHYFVPMRKHFGAGAAASAKKKVAPAKAKAAPAPTNKRATPAMAKKKAAPAKAKKKAAPAKAKKAKTAAKKKPAPKKRAAPKRKAAPKKKAKAKK